MKFGFVAKHRGIWPVRWICGALGVSHGGYYAWLGRPPSDRAMCDAALGRAIRSSFLASDRTYGVRRVWRDVLAAGLDCGRQRIERLMRSLALRARPRRRRLPSDTGIRSPGAVPANTLNRDFEAPRPNAKWVADFTYVWTLEGWLCVAVVLDLFSRRVVGWSMNARMTSELVADALMMAIWRRGRLRPIDGRPCREDRMPRSLYPQHPQARVPRARYRRRHPVRPAAAWAHPDRSDGAAGAAVVGRAAARPRVPRDQPVAVSAEKGTARNGVGEHPPRQAHSGPKPVPESGL